MSARQIIGIDLLRFAAAVAVMFFHLGYWIWAGPESTTFHASGGAVHFPELAFFKFGRVGVDVFFVISGFIIAYSAEHADAFTFFRSRAVRLLPAIWIAASLTLAAVVATDGISFDIIENYVRSIVLYPKGPWIDGVYWTLPIEVSFYAAVLITLAVARFNLLPIIIGVVGASSSIFWIASASGLPQEISFGFIHIAGRRAELILLDHGCLFALGVYIWLATTNALTIVRGGMMLIFTTGGLIEILDWSAGDFVPCIIWLLAMAAMFTASKYNHVLLPCARPARILGLTTYPLYLLHNVIGATLIGRLVIAGLNQHVALAVSVVAVMAAALLIATKIEPYVQQRLRAFIDETTKHIFLLRRKAA